MKKRNGVVALVYPVERGLKPIYLIAYLPVPPLGLLFLTNQQANMESFTCRHLPPPPHHHPLTQYWCVLALSTFIVSAFYVYCFRTSVLNLYDV